MVSLTTDIQYLKGVGEKRSEVLKKMGIDTVGALLRFYPRAYRDWRNILPISECDFNTNVCIKASIISPIDNGSKRPGMTVYKFWAEDKTSKILITLFNQKYLAQKLHIGSEYLFFGKISGDFAFRNMSSPIIKESGFNIIEPIYPATKGLSSANIEKLIKNALASGYCLDNIIPKAISDRNDLCDIRTAINNIHFPLTEELLDKAKKRFVFEELFVLQTGLLFLKSRKKKQAGFKINNDCLEDFKKSLPFTITQSQDKAIRDCIEDMKSGIPMNRLIQGDVGSGKTAVAAALCYVTAMNGFQSAFMAPTEILAEQHFRTLSLLTKEAGIKCCLLSGSLSKKQKDQVKSDLEKGIIDICIGTHAIIRDNVKFKNLALVITDEQHRFGVKQRKDLSLKGDNPHTLVMSATPIPRTIALIIYGDLDISIIDEYPKGRKTINTYLVNSDYKARIYNFIKKHLDEGRQGYIVCPAVDDNENSDVTASTHLYEELKKNDFKNYSLGLLHGKMRGKEKDEVMNKFAEGKIDLLISTTVIEVGIDVPNAVIMVIQNAERFGLSQLHQLRGRIGRGEYESFCILISDSKQEDTIKRLNTIKNCSDGFKIADKDLEMRGPGDFIGSRQHGLPCMKIADLFADKEIFKIAGQEANYILNYDATLSSEENIKLREEITNLYKMLNNN